MYVGTLCRRSKDNQKPEKMGFPIWYWAAPNVVNTFVKQYDFSHKKVLEIYWIPAYNWSVLYE